MKAFAALYKATARQFLRDRMAILFTMLLPVMMAGFFGLIFKEQPASYIPGMLALAILWLGVFGVAPPLVQMREQQVLRRVSATPLKRSTFLAAQVAWRVTTGLLQAVIMLLFGMLALGLKLSGNPLLMVAMTLLGTLVFVTLGFLLAGLARSSESVVAIGQGVQFPMMFLSGTLFPLEMLPDFLRPVTAAMPLTYLTDGLKQTMLNAPPLYPLWLDFTVLGGALLLLLLLATRYFRWE